MPNNNEFIRDSLGRIETKIDKIGIRVSSLEIWRAKIIGQLTIVVIFSTFALNAAWEFIKEKIRI